MIKVDEIEVFNLKGAIRGMRNPMNSWDLSDSISCDSENECKGCPLYNKVEYCFLRGFTTVGDKDLTLMQKLYKTGIEHAKYLRQIFVSMDITAPLYWWKEYDTYKIGTVTSSCSTMHKLMSKHFELKDFSCEKLTSYRESNFKSLIKTLNASRAEYLETKDKNIWYEIIQMLPSSYNQKRTVTMSYQNVMSMINQRENHKLDEWQEFVKILRTLPYIKEIRGETNENKERT